MFQYSSKVFPLLVVVLPLYIFLQLLKQNTNLSTKLPFNHTFSTTFHKSTTITTTNWITSISQERPRRINHDSDEKYLTFFTHSGFQNQLIQVENGILLAWYLNRTLILPKALLGQAFGWNDFSRLYRHHTLRDTSNNYCKQFKDKKSRKLASCPDPSKYALASFEDLFDLSWAKQHVKIEQRDSSDFDWLRYNYGIQRSPNNVDLIQHGSYTDGDILYFKDETRYDWRIYDVPSKHRFLGRYADSLDIAQLQNRSEKLIHFTSLFGTGKFPIKKPENIEFFKSLQQSITYRHPAVLKITEIVIKSLGGEGNFIGAHLRTADGLFINAVPENIENIIRKINEREPKSTHVLPKNKTINEMLSICVGLAKSNKTTLVFLATDAIRPRKNSQFKNLWLHAPCTFTLNEILSEKNPLWSHMDQYRTLHTGESMRKFLIPLVDALVASKGKSFIGTNGSTFSGYIRRLHHTTSI